MEVVAGIAAMRVAAERARVSGSRIGFVPTMGASTRGTCPWSGTCVRGRTSWWSRSSSISPSSARVRTWRGIPGPPQRDCELLAAEGVDSVFAPLAEAIYPEGARTFVEVAGMSDTLEGRSRPGHFRGVTTVVAKLFGMVAPHLAVFGQKDAQQAVIIGAWWRT